MIATFRKESRRTALFAAAVVALALVTLTDARAGERHTLSFPRIMAKSSPETRAVIQRLEQTMSLQLDNASVDDVINAVSNATGVAVKIADDAVTTEKRQKRIKLTAKSVPAHIVLIETLTALDLGVRFTAEGVAIEKLDGKHQVFLRHMDAPNDGEAVKDRVIFVHDAKEIELKNGEKLAVEMRHQSMTPPAGDGHLRQRVEVEENAGADGVLRRNVKFVGADEIEGTLELELK